MPKDWSQKYLPPETHSKQNTDKANRNWLQTSYCPEQVSADNWLQISNCPEEGSADNWLPTSDCPEQGSADNWLQHAINARRLCGQLAALTKSH